MKILMKTIMCGPQGNAHPGEVLDVEHDEVHPLVTGGFASVVKSAPEHAMVPRPEEDAAMHAVSPAKRPRRVRS